MSFYRPRPVDSGNHAGDLFRALLGGGGTDDAPSTAEQPGRLW